MFSPNVANFPKPRPRRPISDDDDDDDEPGQQPSSLIRQLMFTTQNCMTPGRALKRPRAHSESVKVYLRIRPSDSQTIEVKDHESLCMRNPQTGTTNSYKFTRVFDANTSQSKLFSETTVPLIDSLFEGYNALIFAYGITNSGKTYSILGTQIEPGILPKTIQYLFESIRQSGRDLDVYASYLEVHNDILIDLLPAEAQSKTLSLVANKTGHSFIKGLREVKIENVNDAELVLEEGTKHRKCAQTALNTASSRSHALFSLKLVRPGTNKDTEGIVSKLCIVDLAGAERTSRAKNADEHRCRETNNINKSLMQLGRCLEVVRWNQTHPDSKPRPVPWRDSKISRLFKDYLVGGWGRAVMIATVNPDPTDHDETCHALRFAALTSEVESVSKIDHGQNLNLSCESNDGSQDSPDREEELLEEIYHLKLQLLDCERRRCATEAETRNAVCNELQLQAQKRESEFRVQLEEAEERARIRAEKRFNIWKRNMISESDSTVDIDGVFQIAKQKAEADVERQLSKLRSQCETYEVIIKQHESKTIDLQSQLKTLTSKDETIQNAQSQVEELEKKLEIALREISEMEISLEEQKTLNSALKENIVDLKQKKSELEFAVKEAEKRAASADKKEKRSEIIQNKASSLEKKITSLSSVIEQLEQEVSVKTTKIVDYEESLKAASSKELQLSQDLVKLQNEAKIQLEKQSELEKTISNLASLSASQGSIANRLGTENDELRQKIAQADADRVQLLASSSQLQNELEQLRLTIQKLQDSHSDDDSKLELLRESNGLLTRKVELLQDGKRELESKNSSLAEELALCRQELVKELSNVSSVKAENISLHEDLKSLQKTLSETQERVLQLDESESTSAKVMHEENCLLKNQLSSLRKEKAWQLKDLQKKINQLESSSKKQEGKFEKEKMSLQSSLDDVRHNYDKAVSEINDLKSSLNSAEMSTRDLESQIETMRVQHQTSKASETEEKEQLVEMLQKQISELTTELDHQSKENTRLLKDIDDVRLSMQSQIDSLCSEHDIQKKLSQELSSQLLQLSTEKQNLENDVVNSGSQNKSLQDKIEMLENEIETMRTSIAEKKNIEKENRQLQKKLTSLEFQLNKKPRATKQQVALTERISQLELEAAKYADSLTEIEELQQHIELAKANEARLKELAVENERLRQRIQDYDLTAKKRQQIEIQKQELERQLAQLESSNHDITKSSAVDLKLADDISQSTPISRKPVLVDSSNKQMESSKPLKIVSASDQENVAASRMFGKRSRAALEENLKWSSILTSDPFDNVAQKAKESPQPKRKPARKPNKEVADPKSVPKRSTRAGR